MNLSARTVDIKQIISQNLSEFGKLVKSERIRRGWTMEELAFYSIVSFKTIQRVESSEECDISYSTLVKISFTLGIEPTLIYSAPQ